MQWNITIIIVKKNTHARRYVMCGRFTLSVDPVELQLEFQIPEMPAEWRPRFNIAPTQPVAVLTDSKLRTIDFFQWGFVPGWAKDISIGSKMINARSETIMEKPSFRSAFQRRRCLILADGFYEWKRVPGEKGASSPYRFTLINGKPFAFAGLWERWQNSEGNELLSCVIITCPANSIVAPIHERMPVIFDSHSYWQWLDKNDPKELQSMLIGCAPELMQVYPVGKTINNPSFDDSSCILPIAE
jgi:putative SOS response-associated peptidase YedK